MRPRRTGSRSENPLTGDGFPNEPNRDQCVRVWLHLDVGRVVVGILDVREPVSGRLGQVLRLGDKPQQLGPTCDRP